MANIVTLTKDNFEQEVLKAEVPVLVDFWASWCGPCRAVAPVMEALSQEFDGSIKVGKVNVDEQGDLASKFRIMSIPTIMLYKNGQMVEKVIGSRAKEEFTQMIKKYL